MKKQILFLALSMILCKGSFSQITFENGYLINDSNRKIECLIKNMDWKNNPTELQYRLFQDTAVHKASVEDIKEFAINDVSRYVRAKTNIDRSGDQIDEMTSDRNPGFQEEQLFLKVLIEGEASLFLYEEGNLTRFFYSLNDSGIKQLVYKRYLINDDIARNDSYKQQLFLDLKCQDIKSNDVEHLNYTERDLERFFTKYNECAGSGYINYESKQRKDLFNLSIRPGLNYSSLEIQNSTSDLLDTDFGSNIGIRLGIEAEYFLPFNKNKWGITAEPAYQYFRSEKSTETSNVSGGILVSKVNYKSIELPIGVRHYFYLNNGSKIFADVSYVFDFAVNSSVEFMRNDGSVINEFAISTGGNLALGIGYKHKDRYWMEIRYQSNREVLTDYVSWNSDYKTLSVIFGYLLF
jgi:hypothetical protein